MPCFALALGDCDRHLLFSPSFEWEVLVGEDWREEWQISVELPHELPRRSNWIGFTTPGGAYETVTSPPGVMVEGKGGAVEIFKFPEGTQFGELTCRFLKDETVLFALVGAGLAQRETSAASVSVSRPASQAAYKGIGAMPKPYAWVVVIDLVNMERREMELPAWVDRFIVDPSEDRVICRVKGLSASSGMAVAGETVLVSVDGPEVMEHIRWEGGEEPFLAWEEMHTAFLSRDEVVYVDSADPSRVLRWRVGDRTTQELALPEREVADR